MSINTLFFRNRYLLGVTIALLVIVGIWSVLALPRLEDPRITNRDPIIITPYPGATAERVEVLITEPIEKMLQEVAAIKKTASLSSAGVSIISIELDDGVTAEHNQEIFAEIRNKVADIAQTLPEQSRPPIVDDKRDPSAYTHIAAVSWTSDSEMNLTLMNRVAEELAQRIRALPGTDIVRTNGAPDEEILVMVSPDLLAELGIDAERVAAALASADAKSPAGQLHSGIVDVNIEVAGELDSLQRIRKVPVLRNQDKGIVRVSDLAQVSRTHRTPESEIATSNGKRVILVSSRMLSANHIDAWGDAVNATIAALQQELGSAISIVPVFEQQGYTLKQLSSLVSNLVAGAAVVMLVVLLTMGWRLSLIVGSALPLVAAAVLFAMHLTGAAIHQMSIYGMIIALGLLIDNAIVVADEVTKNKSMGKSDLDAVQEAVSHLFYPLLASTLTTILAFMPIVLLEGSVGDFVESIGSTVIMALIASFAIAMTVISALAGLYAKPINPERNSWWESGIRLAATQAKLEGVYLTLLRKPVIAILLAVFFPLAGFVVATQLGKQFFPPVDRDMIHVKVWLPTNSSIRETERTTQQINQMLGAYAQIEDINWLVGGSFPSVYYNTVMHQDESAYYAHGIIKVESSEQAKAMIAPLQAQLLDTFPQAQILVQQFAQGPPTFEDIEYRIFGPDVKVLKMLGDRIRLELQRQPDVLFTRTTLPGGEPKLVFVADEDEAQQVGLTLGDIAHQMQGNMEGIHGGVVLEDLQQLPVRVRLEEEVRAHFTRIQDLKLVSPLSNEWIPLSAIGHFELVPERASISHWNGLRVNRIKGYVRNGALPIDITHQVLKDLAKQGFKLPPGYRIELGGFAEKDEDAVANILEHLPLLLIMTVATLILLFKSVQVSLILGLVAAFSLGLGFLSTGLMGFPISFNTILGTLGLIGLAFNNSIVVLAAIFANERAKAGYLEPMVEAIMSTSRHILSTTLTTIGGFLPILLFVGGDFWPSLSIVLAGGVAGSMILALLFVPAAYLMITPSPLVENPSVSDLPLLTGLES